MQAEIQTRNLIICPRPQDFITGPANAATNGYFGVDYVTGEGESTAAGGAVGCSLAHLQRQLRLRLTHVRQFKHCGAPSPPSPPTGYAFATNAWAPAPELPSDNHCVDSWTNAPVRVPISGITPYPAAAEGIPNWATRAVVTPAAMLTVGDALAGDAGARYTAAYAALNVTSKAELYPGGGLMASDPQLLLASGETLKVGAAVRAGAAEL